MNFPKVWQTCVLALFFAGSLLHFELLSRAQDPSAVARPFTLDWTEGLCKHCGTARQLGTLRFTEPDVAWALGFRPPSGADVTASYMIVHTANSGVKWKEMRFSETHTAPPVFSFIDALNGWVSGMSPVGETWVYRTADAGRHFTKVSERILQALVFVDGTHGYGKVGNHFFRSSDGGQTWTESELTAIGFIDQMFFLNQQTGWVTGTDGEDAVVLRTSDGGEHWEASRIPTGAKVADVHDVYFANPREGWLVTWHSNDQGSHLFRSRDGGETWNADPDATIQGARNWLSGVRVMRNHLAFGFGRTDAEGSNKGVLLYSSDTGEHWQKFGVERAINDCQAFEGNLFCSAVSGESGLWLLNVHPRP